MSRPPLAVLDLARRLGARGQGGSAVRFSQTGRLRQRATASWSIFPGKLAWEMPGAAFTYWQGRLGAWERKRHD